ncbi:SRPBCC family protein [Sagittula sp. SSi028]|uniref:SRPBCC family protein n=1 Tax=Sagittula sp. SSi028 TaxID=3400636 RepID=UPI003AF502ED
MELKDEIRINASKDVVCASLQEPEVLRRCIPGCEELTQTAENTFEATILLKVGPVKARFSGVVELDTSQAPDALSLSGQGNGGAAGHAKGGADVTLTEAEGETILSYDAKAEIGGKLAQLGSRLIQSTAKKLAGKFFKSFAEVVEEDRVA